MPSPNSIINKYRLKERIGTIPAAHLGRNIKPSEYSHEATSTTPMPAPKNQKLTKALISVKLPPHTKRNFQSD